MTWASEATGKSTATLTRQLLRITTAGSVDDGKSTLIGRLLHDTDSLPLDHLEAVTDDEGVADLAALSDGLRAEREQGITIDVAYRFFSTGNPRGCSNGKGRWFCLDGSFSHLFVGGIGSYLPSP